MKLATKYNRVNLFTSLVALIITGFIYYLVVHFILIQKLDRDLAVEEDEIRQYAANYHTLPLPSSYLDQQVYFKEIRSGTGPTRKFGYVDYLNTKEHEIEPGRSLITTLSLNNKIYEVTIIKSSVETDDLVRIISFITLGVTTILLLAIILINRLSLNKLWKPFYTILAQMKAFDLTQMDNLIQEPTSIDEFKELNRSAAAMATRVKKDYDDLKSFTDNASHEMMTPLAIINTKLDSLLQTDSFTAEQGTILADIYHGVGRLFKLNQSLLLLAKIENNLILDLQDIDMKDLMANKITHFEALFEKYDLHVNSTLETCSVKMSRYLADILLNNLLGNAVRHNHNQGKINIAVRQNSITINNTGKNEKLDDQLFERFSKSANSEGMGLGLAISRQICNLYGFAIGYTFLDNEHRFTINFLPSDNFRMATI